MATYCFTCPQCGKTQTYPDRLDYLCPSCIFEGSAPPLRRDYRAENVGVAVQQLKNEREAGGTKAHDELFLPSNREFAGPGDPDGTKGMREWRENHQPKPGNKNPRWPGEVEKKVW